MKKRKLHEMRDKMQKIYLQFDREYTNIHINK